MKTILVAVLCSAAIFASGCTTSQSRANGWEYKSSGTTVDNAGNEVNRMAQQGWRLVSMSAASSQNYSGVEVVLLFKKHK
ncbi:MAG: hypothetical protein ABSE48_18735 [Verrucomicrobiota bacterium]|jgi:hypothetical protein